MKIAACRFITPLTRLLERYRLGTSYPEIAHTIVGVGTMRFIRIDRLTLRLAIGITVLVSGVLALGLWILSEHHFRHMLDARRRAAEMQNRIFEAALRNQMLTKDTNLIASILEEIGSQPEVQNAMILDHDGLVRYSSRPEFVGQKVSHDTPTCMICHYQEPEKRSRWAMLQSSNGGILRSVQPFENRPECYRCHDPAKRVNGILILDVSLAGIEAQLHQDRLWMVLWAAGLGLLLLSSIGLPVRHLILTRLTRLGQTARAITAGNLNERAAVQGDDTITRLASDFNNMTNAMIGLITEVRESEAQLANVINSLDDGLVVLDRNLLIVAANQAFCRRLGLPPEAVRGQSCRLVSRGILPCEAGDFECPTARCFSRGESQRMTFHLPVPGEEAGLVEEVHASPVFDNDGVVIRVVEIWRDISERVNEENRLAEFERLESLGVLASGFSHEVNTPLASTLTCAEAILDRLHKPMEGDAHRQTLAEIEERAEIIRAEVLRCHRITERFLRFSRGIPPSREPVDVRAVVDSILPVVAPTARQARVHLKTEGESAVPPVVANAEVLQHVLLNLLLNAIQSFDGRGGNVVVSYRIDSNVRVRIQDDGPGIPPAARKNLFEPFRSSRREGTGVGLFLSRCFMRRFGGDVRLVEGDENRGACFEIVFDATREAAS